MLLSKEQQNAQLQKQKLVPNVSKAWLLKVKKQLDKANMPHKDGQ